MRYLSLFSGIEAASSAWSPLGWQCVGVSDIEPFPCAVLAHHYPAVPNLGDVTKITEADIAALGPIDAVVFGSPCQDLSVAGKRKGLEGARSGLFFTAMRIIGWARQHCGLRWALWENVPGAFSSNKGADFAAVVDALAGLDGTTAPPKGWGTEGCAAGAKAMVEWSTLDAQWFGVAQRRRRVFALADFGDWSGRPPILLEPQSLRGDTAPSREAGQGITHSTAPCLTSSGRGVERTGDTRGQDPVVAVAGGGLVRVIPSTADVAHCLNAGGMGRLDYETETLLAMCASGEVAHTLKAEGFDASEDGTGRGTPPVVVLPFDTTQITSKANGSNPKPGDPCHPLAAGAHAIAFNSNAQPDEMRFDMHVSAALTCSQSSAVAIPNMQVRRLTPVECERLQGFPDNHTRIPTGKSGKPAADGPRYKALGNSMAVPVMRWIGTQIDFAHHNF